MGDFEFVLQDAWGKPHSYKGTLIPTRKGLPLASELMEVFSPGLIGLFQKGDLANVDPNLLVVSASGLLKTVDLEFVQKRILANVLRDESPVAPDDQFDRIYAGNYTELWAAVYEVVRHNRFLPFLDSMPNVAEFSAMLERRTKETTAKLDAATGPGPSNAGSTSGSHPSPT